MKRFFAALAASAAVGMILPTAASASVDVISGGGAFAAEASIPAGSSLVTVGPIANAALGCSVAATQSTANSVASIALGNPRALLSSGTAYDSVAANRTSTMATVQSLSSVQSINALNGLIKASLIKMVLTSSAMSSSSFASSEVGTQFTGLTINGVPVAGTPPPNTQVLVPGFGVAILNEVTSPSPGVAVLTGIDISITTANTLGLAVGTHIFVARVRTQFIAVAAPRIVAGGGWGLYAKGFGGSLTATSGPWSVVGSPCQGGSAQTSLAFVHTPIGSTATMATLGQGAIFAAIQTAQGRSTIQTLNLLSGFIRASAVGSLAHAALNSGIPQTSGSVSLVSAFLNNRALAANPGPNTTVNIAGLGYAKLNEQGILASSSMAAIFVNAIDVYVTTANLFNLPVGARIIVSHAVAQVIGF